MPTVVDYFTYTPVHGPAEAAAVLFAAICVVVAVQTRKAKASRWTYILAATAAAESIGYILRAVCIEHISLALFINMNLYLLLPPNALALFNYKSLGDVVRQSGVPARRFWLRPRFITWFFFASDILSFLLQSAGASMTAQESTVTAGRWICLVGLAIQLVFLALYLVTVAIVTRNPLYVVGKHPGAMDSAKAKRRLMVIIISTTVLLYVRSIYRLIEFADGYGGKIYRAEWALYVFDTLAILAMFAVYIGLGVVRFFPRGSEVAEMSLEELVAAQ
ncbi:hypothetical protein LPJ61_002381 [Coemansia biformis]|uniref:RTA1-domain-containing protein n=1 Tax=Coemansia biformis TaxID=1286918 RepID=A0A9W7YDF4_9FUNG|nr:hypothetical protein LPJ61_002381 [Coemansia biformis]